MDIGSYGIYCHVYVMHVHYVIETYSYFSTAIIKLEIRVTLPVKMIMRLHVQLIFYYYRYCRW